MDHPCFRSDWRDEGDIQCAFSSFILLFTSMNASGHLVGLAVDRVLILSDTIWHHSITWRRKIPLISLGMSLFHMIIYVPRFLYISTDNKCGIRTGVHFAAKVYEILLTTLFFTVTHFFAVSVATVLFIRNLRERRNTENHTVGDCHSSQERQDSSKISIPADGMKGSQVSCLVTDMKTSTVKHDRAAGMKAFIVE